MLERRNSTQGASALTPVPEYRERGERHSMKSLLRKPAFRVQRGLAAAAGGRHGLAIVVVGHIPRGKDAFNARVGTLRLCPDDVALWVELQLTAEEIGIGRMAN